MQNEVQNNTAARIHFFTFTVPDLKAHFQVSRKVLRIFLSQLSAHTLSHLLPEDNKYVTGEIFDQRIVVETDHTSEEKWRKLPTKLNKHLNRFSCLCLTQQSKFNLNLKNKSTEAMSLDFIPLILLHYRCTV